MQIPLKIPPGIKLAQVGKENSWTDGSMDRWMDGKFYLSTVV